MTHTYSDSEFKNIKKGFYNLSLVKTDRNGTRYYEGVQECWKCGGHRVFDCWGHVSNGVCFACNGTGVNPVKVKVATDEYAQKLENKRIAKQEAELAERKAHASKLNADFYAKEGFNAEGMAWLVVKTGFVEKEFTEEILSKGAKKYSFNIYVFSAPNADYDCIEVNAKDCCSADMYGVYYDIDYRYMNTLLEDVQEKERKAVAEKYSYFGTIGDKVELTVTFKNVFWYDTQFGTMSIYIFEDVDGHQFKWNTSSGLPSNIEKEEVITIKGTIKDHSEYNSVKQTVLTRCKLVA